jgi:hypothetical protein
LGVRVGYVSGYIGYFPTITLKSSSFIQPILQNRRTQKPAVCHALKKGA